MHPFNLSYLGYIWQLSLRGIRYSAFGGSPKRKAKIGKIGKKKRRITPYPLSGKEIRLVSRDIDLYGIGIIRIVVLVEQILRSWRQSCPGYGHVIYY
jgi:hypothetical protein